MPVMFHKQITATTFSHVCITYLVDSIHLTLTFSKSTTETLENSESKLTIKTPQRRH